MILQKKAQKKTTQMTTISWSFIQNTNNGWGNTNALINLINHQPDTDKIYSYARYPCEAKCQLLISKREI